MSIHTAEDFQAELDRKNMLDKTQVLLKAWEMQGDGLRRAQEREQRIFQWSTSLLLATFGAIFTLSSSSSIDPSGFMVKILVTIMIVIPTTASIAWMLRRSKRAVRYARVYERIENLLHLFEDGYYGPHSAYPKDWEHQLTQNWEKRRTPIYYSFVLGIMMICVVVAVWSMF